MFFRNLTLFRFLTDVAHAFTSTPSMGRQSFEMLAPTALALLQECALKPVGPLELASRGFIPPHGSDSDVMAVIHGDHVWLTIGAEEKILPAAAVNRELGKRLDAIEAAEGRKPGGRTRKRIKEDVIHELLPKALVKPVRVDAMLDLRRGLLAVDTSSRRTAETVVSEIRRALGSFPALLVNAEVAPRAVLTGWIAGEPLPSGLAPGEECELKDAMDGGAVIKCQHQELGGAEIGKHLESGKQVTRLALTLDDLVSFVIGEDLVVRKLRFLDGAMDALENTEREDRAAELDARFLVMASTIGRLFDTLEAALRLSKVEG